MGKPIAASLALILLLAPAPITIRANPAWGYNLSTRVTIQVEPSDLNRQICFSYDSGDVYSSSCWRIDGRSPKTTTKTVEALREGIYIFAVEVLRSDGSRSIATTKVCSLGPDTGPDQCNPTIE